MKDFEIRCDESHLETNNIIYGKFTLGPFLPGQGTTFGNALRRSLLSELAGLSITAFEVMGVMQEFSTLPGLRESVLDLSLNLKQIVLTGILPRSTPPIGFLKIRGPAIIKAADLKLPAGIYCVSPEHYIGTLTSNGILNIKFLVSVGKGHSIQPHSLYRSLSKAKLQPTLSSNFLNNNYDGLASLEGSSATLSRGLKSDQSTFSSVEQRGIGLASLEGSSAQDSHTKSLFDNLRSTATNSNWHVAAEQPSLYRLQSNPNNKSESQKNLHSPPASQAPNGGKEAKVANDGRSSLSSNFLADGSSGEARTTAGIYSKARGGSKINTAKKLNSFEPKEYANIQKQIFQRINPQQVLPIDAVFTPISQVNFLIQVNDRFETARENIVLEIWTNGSIHPKRALEEATLSLVQNFDALLKKIKHVSSFSKGLRYWNYLQTSDSYDNSTTQLETVTPYGGKKRSKQAPYGACEAEKQAPQRGAGFDASTVIKTDSGNSTALPPQNREHEVGSIAIPTNHRTLTKNTSNSKNNDEVLILKDRMPLHKAIYNLDIGNLDLSLQTFVLLKKAKISKLAHLLTKLNLSSKSDNLAVLQANNLNEKTINELKGAVNQFGLNL